MSKILLVGENALLQQTRAAVLRTIGAEIVCTDSNAAVDVQKDSVCDLVVLCHSVPEALTAHLAETIHTRWPETRILQMTSSRVWETARTIPAIDTISSTDPERMVMHVVELLGRRQPGSVRLADPSSGRISA